METIDTPADFFAKHTACANGAAFALQFGTLAEAWAACQRADWMLWGLQKAGKTERLARPLRVFACECAAASNHPASPRCLAALAVAWRYAAGLATVEELRGAAAYAADAADAAHDAYAATSVSPVAVVASRASARAARAAADAAHSSDAYASTADAARASAEAAYAGAAASADSAIDAIAAIDAARAAYAEARREQAERLRALLITNPFAANTTPRGEQA